MSEIVELPVLYTVDGTLRNRRRRLLHPVVELVPVEVDALEGGETFSAGGSGIVVVGGRPWLPIRTPDLSPMTPAGATAYATGFAESTKGMDAHREPEVSALAGRPWRPLAHEQGVVVVPRGASWTRPFGRIDATDREAAMDMARDLSRRLITIDGVLHTDRYEPLVSSIDRTKDYRMAFDLVMGCDRSTVQGWKHLGETTALGPGQSTNEPLDLPHDEPWARDVAFETDPTILAALMLSRRMSYLYTPHNDRRPVIQEALGYEADAVVSGLVQWGSERRSGLRTPMSLDRLTTSIETLRKAMARPHILGAPEALDVLSSHLDATEIVLECAAARLADAPRAIEDVEALRTLAPASGMEGIRP